MSPTASASPCWRSSGTTSSPRVRTWAIGMVSSAIHGAESKLNSSVPASNSACGSPLRISAWAHLPILVPMTLNTVCSQPQYRSFTGANREAAATTGSSANRIARHPRPRKLVAVAPRTSPLIRSGAARATSWAMAPPME